jgi:SAM-dependent methyltransferase
MSLLADGRLDLAAIDRLTRKPALFSGGTAHFWADPHIAQHMLEAHLDPNFEAASRPPQVIEATVTWLWDRLDLKAGDRLLDLGCGPGLYTRRFAERGLTVIGVDFSENSIRYAREHDPDSSYICQDYLTLDLPGPFDLVTLIYGDLCVLADDKRDRLLAYIHQSLKPGGRFVFDVTTAQHHQSRWSGTSWQVAPEGGFWKPGPHLVLQQGFHYPEADTALEQYLVIEDDGTMTVYRNWFHYYSVDTISAVLEQQGFAVEGVYGDLAGAPPTRDGEWIGVITQKQP